jgi:hypothetical protein
MEEFLKEVREFTSSECKRTGMPVGPHIDIATQKGKEIAPKLGANIAIVEAGTLLMDCQLGQALSENRMQDHIKMSLDEANEIMNKYDLDEKDKENIRHCVLEHHGVPKFYSLESEIVCNADCYRFTSTQGFAFAMRYLRAMPFDDLVKLLKDKVSEKWNAITLDIVKEDLEPQHNAILNILKDL